MSEIRAGRRRGERGRGGGGIATRESLFLQHFQAYFCILSSFYDIFQLNKDLSFGLI